MKTPVPILLALETATDACSVALGVGERVYTREAVGQRIHTQSLIPMIHAVLAESGYDLSAVTALAVGRGPGSFTGVRIAVGLAQGLAYGLKCPVYPISTLAALAQQAVALGTAGETQALLVPILDARMQEIYVGGYEYVPAAKNAPAAIRAVTEEQLIRPEHLDIYLAAAAYSQQIRIENTLPRAVDVLQLALQQYHQGNPGIAALDVVPTYLRDNVAQVSVKKLR